MSKIAHPDSVFSAGDPRVFSIDPGRPFLPDLAGALIDSLGEALPRAEIFLPTRRAVRTAGEAILDACETRGVRAALLPRFRAIGDIDDDELIAFAGDAEDEIDLPPPISPTERMVMLARFVAARDRAFAGQENWPAAIGAAKELAKLLDSFYTDEVEFSALADLVIEDVAGHWAKALKFLSIVTIEWPRYLKGVNRSDPAERRARLISATARRIAENPPAHPLLIAGTTASAPAVARLVGAIARAPMGAAILPGLDRRLDRRAWSAIDDAHPQSGLKSLLDAMELAPSDVRPWPKSGGGDARADLLTLALRPAEATDDWLTLVSEMTDTDDRLAAATRNLRLVEADNDEAEATIVAAIFRQTIETPGKTAILVTPDRHLSRRVALKMRRWNVQIDDSAGVPFSNTRCGVFLRLAALFIEDPGDPVAILALLRHPYGSCAEQSKAVAALDRALRGARPANGLSSVARSLQEKGLLSEDVASLINALSEAARLFSDVEGQDFSARLSAHVAAAEFLAGAERLWSGADGEKGAMLLAELANCAASLDFGGGGRYSEIFAALMAGAAVRPHTDIHPRLAILGPLEARLQSADHMILGGLNEGAWPSDAASDPFLSRPMRAAIGLSSPERRIGLSAHDFASFAAHPEVTLTRAKRAGGNPAKPSRWLVRLRNILESAGALERVDASPSWRARAARLDAAAEFSPVDRPRPPAGPGRRPPVVSVTRIEKWLRDPYSIFAYYLLRLRKLEEPDLAFCVREMGTLLHRVFERAVHSQKPLTTESLRELFGQLAEEAGLVVADRRFWSAAIDQSLQWFIDFDRERGAKGRIVIAEVEGRWTLDGVDPPFTLTAKADRIDLLDDGGVALFDYKSGKLKTEKQDRSFSPQLSLTGAIVAAGGFAEIGARRVSSFDYLKIANLDNDPQKNRWGLSGEEAEAAIRDAEARLRALVAFYDQPDAGYPSQPRPEFTDDFGEYDQLARRKEWASAEDGGEGGE